MYVCNVRWLVYLFQLFVLFFITSHVCVVTYFNFLYTKYKCICKVVCFLSSFPPHTARRSLVFTSKCASWTNTVRKTLVAARVLFLQDYLDIYINRIQKTDCSCTFSCLDLSKWPNESFWLKMMALIQLHQQAFQHTSRLQFSLLFFTAALKQLQEPAVHEAKLISRTGLVSKSSGSVTLNHVLNFTKACVSAPYFASVVERCCK